MPPRSLDGASATPTKTPARQPASSARPAGASGIFGADWHKWRGATLEITLPGEPPLIARLEAVGSPSSTGRPRASLTVLDGALKPTGIRELPWPPEGRVRVVRAP